MSDESSRKALIRIDGRAISQVANNLINKMSKGPGTLYEPVHEKRMAKARAANRILEAKTDIEITDLERRAMARWIQEEARNQENLESVIKGAIPDLKDDSKPENLDDDWVARFSDYAKKVSDKEMQSLWSKILAGQVNGSGSFRKSLLHTVSLLEKEDAELFVKVCRCGVFIGVFTPLIFNVDDDVYKAVGLNFGHLAHLDTIGLINFDTIAGFVRNDLPAEFIIEYARSPYKVTMPAGRTSMPIGKIRLTEVGRQLVPLSNARALPNFPDYFIEKWKESNIIVESLLESSDNG
jgi:hypothetical protein